MLDSRAEGPGVSDMGNAPQLWERGHPGRLRHGQDARATSAAALTERGALARVRTVLPAPTLSQSLDPLPRLHDLHAGIWRWEDLPSKT